MKELAFFSVFAFPTHEIEAGFATKETGSGQFLLYQYRSTYALASAISDWESLVCDHHEVISATDKGNRARPTQG